MVDSALLSFSFIQGVLAFFAPCAISLLPGYLSHLVSKGVQETAPGNSLLVRRSLFFSLSTIAGIVTIYAMATLLIFTLRELIKMSLVYISMGMGVAVMVLGVMMLSGKTVSLHFKSPQLQSKSQVIEAYFFGITFAIGVLGCLFPLFLTVAVAAIQSPSILIGSTYLLAYLAGMSLLMVVFYVVAQFARGFLHNTIGKIMPYMNKVGGALIVLAGVYIIWYQSALL